MTKEPSSHRNSEKQISFLLERGRYAQAAEFIGKELAKNPDNPDLLYFSAKVDMELGNKEEAEKTLNHLLSLNPDNNDARYLLARMYINQDRFHESEPLLIDLIREYPEVPEYYSLYAYVMLSTLHLDKADKLAREAIRLDPENISALHTSVFCGVIRHNNKEARERLAEMIHHYPEETGTALALIAILTEKGKNHEALRIAREVLRSDPDNEGLVDLIKELRVLTHPCMIPLYPFSRFGWHGSAATWILAVVLYQLVLKFGSPGAAATFGGVWLAYVIYSWVFPPLLRRFM